MNRFESNWTLLYAEWIVLNFGWSRAAVRLDLLVFVFSNIMVPFKLTSTAPDKRFRWVSTQKWSTYRNCIWMPLKLEKFENRPFLRNHFAFISSTLVKYVKTTLFWALHFSAFTNTTDTFSKNKWYHMILEGLSCVCAKLEPASSKNNEILEINVLQKFTPHTLQETFRKLSGK